MANVSKLKKLGAGNLTSLTCDSIFAQNLDSKNIYCGIGTFLKINNPQLQCATDVINSMFVINKNYTTKTCEVTGLTDDFKDLICDAVNNYCPYYYCGCSGVKGIGQNNKVFTRGFNNFNNFNSSDNSVSFFHEEIMGADSDNIMNTDLSLENLSSEINSYSNFISKNLSANETVSENNLKILSIEKILQGVWLLNGNVTIEIPAETEFTSFKLFVYLGSDIVPSGEIILGSHQKSAGNIIKSYPFNLMFKNDMNGNELKVGLIFSGNNHDIKILKTTNFFANKM